MIELNHGEHTTAGKDVKEFVSRLIFVAEIRPEGVPGLSSNHVLEKSRVMSMVRSSVRSSGGSNVGELVVGKVEYSNFEEKKSSVHVKFNAEQHSWDYSWKSNRWEVNKTHVIDVMVMEDTSDGSLRVLKNCPSKSFTIFSARHIKTNASVGAAAGTCATVSRDTAPSSGGRLRGVTGRNGTGKRFASKQQAWQEQQQQVQQMHHDVPMFADVNWHLPVPPSLGMGVGVFPAPHYPTAYNQYVRDSMLRGELSNVIYDQIEERKRASGYNHSHSSDSSSTGDDDITGKHTNGNNSSGGSASSDDGDEPDGGSPKRQRTESEDSKLLGLCNVIEAISRGYGV